MSNNENENDLNKKPVVKRGRPSKNENKKKVTFVEPVKIVQPTIVQPTIEVPKLVQQKEIITKIIEPKDFYLQQLEFFVLQINNVIELIQKSERPLIVAGRGIKISTAENSLKQLKQLL